MSTPAVDIATYFAANGLGVFAPSGGTIFAGEMPDDPDDVLVIRDTPSFPGEFVQGQTDPIMERPSVSVSVRAATQAAAHTRVTNAYRAAMNISNTTINGTRYLTSTPQMPFQLPRDPKTVAGRVLFIFNIELERDYPTS